MLLARTDPDVPKHRGITYFVIDMHQPGVEVRPLEPDERASSFCEVFLTDARVPADRVVGAVNGGWQVAQTTLFHERNSTAGGGLPGLVPARSGHAGDLDRTVGEVIERARRVAAERRSAIRGGAIPVKAMLELAASVRRVRRPGATPGTGPLRQPGPDQRLDHAAHRRPPAAG